MVGPAAQAVIDVLCTRVRVCVLADVKAFYRGERLNKNVCYRLKQLCLSRIVNSPFNLYPQFIYETMEEWIDSEVDLCV